ncbi:MAG TPA: hypothetical protein VHK47_04025, partial [Polyangia bacterium]|nr:hypothetical protein [Polyangia bacterium]
MRARGGVEVAAALLWLALASSPARAEVPAGDAPAPVAGLRVTVTPEREFLVLGDDADVTVDVEVVGPGSDGAT